MATLLLSGLTYNKVKDCVMKQHTQCCFGLFLLLMLMPHPTTCCFNWCKKKQNKIIPTSVIQQAQPLHEVIVIQQTPTLDEINKQLSTIDEQVKDLTTSAFEGKKNNLDFDQINNQFAQAQNQFNLVKNKTNPTDPYCIETVLKINFLQQRFTFAKRLTKKSSSQQNINKMPAPID